MVQRQTDQLKNRQQVMIKYKHTCHIVLSKDMPAIIRAGKAIINSDSQRTRIPKEIAGMQEIKPYDAMSWFFKIRAEKIHGTPWRRQE